MDNRLNWIIFLVLAFAIMIGQAYFFGEKPADTQKQNQQEKSKEKEAEDRRESNVDGKRKAVSGNCVGHRPRSR